MRGSPLGRIVEIAEPGRHLAKERGFLVVTERGAEIGRVPLDDIEAVVAADAGTTTSCALLADLAERGIPVVLCGRNHAPSGLVWPVAGHHAQQRRMEAQLSAPRPLTKRLWALLVAAKLRRQGWALERRGQPAGAFARLAREVRSGDPDNLEAQAARRYWPLIMGVAFRRDPDADGANALLNYGYAVLRAGTARAIAAAGLHPGLGIFHRHPQNSMPLADDLMEPFRPVVDVSVAELLDGGAVGLDTVAKRRLAAVLWQDEPTKAGISPLSTCLMRLASSLASSFLSGVPELDLPLLAFPRDDAPFC